MLLLQVISPYGSVLHHKENPTNGQFAFTTQESGTYLACFEVEGKSHSNKDISINIDWKTVISAKEDRGQIFYDILTVYNRLSKNRLCNERA